MKKLQTDPFNFVVVVQAINMAPLLTTLSWFITSNANDSQNQKNQSHLSNNLSSLFNRFVILL